MNRWFSRVFLSASWSRRSVFEN